MGNRRPTVESAYIQHPLHLSLEAKPVVRALEMSMAKDLFEDFARLIPSRMTQLQRVVVMDNEFAAWKADFTRESLRQLMHWFGARVYITQQQDQRIVEVVPVGPRPPGPTQRMEVPHFTALTRSFLLDIGTYWGECFRVVERGFRWERVARPRNHSDLNFPAITGPRLGFQFVPWHNLGIWLIRHFRDREPLEAFVGSYDRILALPRPSRKGKTASEE